MVVFKAFAPGIDVIGQGVLSMVSGMHDKEIAFKILASHGLGDIKPDA